MTPPAASAAWTMEIDRADLSRSRLLPTGVPSPEPGEAILRVDRVGLTANNVTYAVLGDSFRYWEFFPASPGWGIVPVWGFAEVAASRAQGVREGDRVYGYLPTASHLRVRPGRADERGFREASPHRATLPSPYNTYALTTGDPAYDAAQEDLQVLYRPLYWTSFMLADWLIDNDLFGAETVLVSSASSKTAYGAAFDLHAQGRHVIGLTSPGNTEFVRSLGCYDEVRSYDELDQLAAGRRTLYADLAGEPELTARLRTRLGDRLVHEVVVGVTHQEAAAAGTLADTGPAMFFAPDQMRKRIGDWGRDGLDRRFAEAWQAFCPVVAGWVDVVEHRGPEALEQVWRQVQSGALDPRVGHVIAL